MPEQARGQRREQMWLYAAVRKARGALQVVSQFEI